MRLGPYELGKQIGEGGMGIVFHARSPDGRDVAIKVLRRGATKGRFDRERRLLEALGDEEGFVPLLDAGESPHGPYYVMPYLGGGTLRDKLEKGRLDAEDTLDLMVFLAATLGRAHAKGIIHRDLKPENILFTTDRRPLVADLGLAKHWDKEVTGASRSVSLSIGGDMRGTAGYMAPEQMKDAKNVGPAADVFSIGAIAYECLTGQPAFGGTNMLAVLEKVESGRHESLKIARPDAPAWLTRIIERALAVDPARRFPDGDALLEALERPPEKPFIGKRGIAALGVAAGAVLGACIVVASNVGGGGRDPGLSGTGSGSVTIVHKDEKPKDTRPAWFLALPEKERPRLAAGVKISDVPGELVNEKDGSILVRVPGGECQLGNDHRAASLPTFLIGKLEVTNAQFEKFVKATGYKTTAEETGAAFVANPKQGEADAMFGGYETTPNANWRDPELRGRPAADEPVCQVSWIDARAYCDWAGLVLPTSDEWEKAASWDPAQRRARRYPWGDEEPSPGSEKLANIGDRQFLRVHLNRNRAIYDDGYPYRSPVGALPLDRSPCGAFDMGGNISEWLRDVIKDGASDIYDKRLYTKTNWTTDAFPCTEREDPSPPKTAADWLGFRVALELEKR